MASGLLLAAGQTEKQCKWNELPAYVVKQKVTMALTSGTWVEGKVLSVEPEGLRLRVSKTSNRRAIAKGKGLIPRASISVVQVTRYRKWGRLLCTLGAAGAAAAIVTTRNIDLYEGPLVVLVPALSAAGTVGVGIAGYYIGKRIDRQVIYLRVTPGD